MKVLLVDPGSINSGAWGSSQTTRLALLSLHSYLSEHAPGVEVSVCDLEMLLPQPLAEPDLERYRAGIEATPAAHDFDVLAVSCRSSLKVRTALAVGEIARRLHPEATIVVGGDHPSALPQDFEFDGSPFDHVVTGEGEKALLDIIHGKASGRLEGALLQGDQEPRLRWDEYPLYHGAEVG